MNLLNEAKNWARRKLGVGVAGGGDYGNAALSYGKKLYQQNKPLADLINQKLIQPKIAPIRALPSLIEQQAARELKMPRDQNRIIMDNVARPFIRTVAEGVNQIRGSEGFTPTSSTAKLFLGEQPLKNTVGRFKGDIQGARDLGFGKASVPVGLAAGLLATTGDLTPLGGGKSKGASKAAGIASDVVKGATKGNGLVDTINAVRTYTKPGQVMDMTKVPAQKAMDIVDQGKKLVNPLKVTGRSVEEAVDITNPAKKALAEKVAGYVDQYGRPLNPSRMPEKNVATKVIDKVSEAVDNGDRELSEALEYAKAKARTGNFVNFYNNSPERIIEENFGPYANKVKEYFTKATTAAEEQNKLWRDAELTGIRSKLQGLGIKAKSAKDRLLFNRANGTLSLSKLKELAPQNWKQIEEGTQFVKAKYDDYLAQINKVLTKYGYDAIPKREDYITHINELSVVQEALGNLTGTSKKELPTVLAKAMDYAKTGKEFFAFGKPRSGKSPFTESAYAALDAYVPGAGRQIFHTPAIQKAREFQGALEKEFADSSLPIVNWTKEYIDRNLVGKMTGFDKSIADNISKRMPKILDAARKRLSANQVGGNLSSALTNFIPLTQMAATTKKSAVLRGLASMNPADDITKIDGIRSSFLTRRFRGETRLLESMGDKAIEVGSAPFKLVDKTSSKLTVAAKYYEGLEQGLSKSQAMKQADEYAAKLITDRSWGQMPNIYKEKMLGLITQYQAEVNNQLYFLLRDMPKSAKSLPHLASMTGQVLLYSYVYNELFEKLTGRRPAIDPIGTGMKINDIYQSDRSPDRKVADISQAATDQLPYIGTFLGGGRIPISNVMPKVSDFTGSGGVMGGLKTTAKDLGFAFGLPTAGGQVKKTLEGRKAYDQGYSEAPAGGVRFPIEQNTANKLRALLFGQYATAEGQDYLKQGSTPLGANQSAFLKGISDKAGVYNALRSGQKNANLMDKANQALASGKDASKILSQMGTTSGTNSIEDIIEAPDGFIVMNQDGKLVKKYTREDAVIEQGKAKLMNSGQSKLETGDYIFLKGKNGKITYKPIEEYEFQKNEKNWILLADKYKANDDYGAWQKLAANRFNYLQKRLEGLDMVTDEIEILEIQKKMQDLLQDAAKYSSYGGFKKGSKGKKLPKVSVTDSGLIQAPKVNRLQGLRKPRL